MHIYIYIYICIERERERERDAYIYIYIHIYTHNMFIITLSLSLSLSRSQLSLPLSIPSPSSLNFSLPSATKPNPCRPPLIKMITTIVMIMIIIVIVLILLIALIEHDLRNSPMHDHQSELGLPNLSRDIHTHNPCQEEFDKLGFPSGIIRQNCNDADNISMARARMTRVNRKVKSSYTNFRLYPFIMKLFYELSWAWAWV